MTEYRTVTKSLVIQKDIEQLTINELQQIMTKAIAGITEEVSENLKTLDGGGWEIITRELTKFNNKFIVSFLLKRQSKMNYRIPHPSAPPRPGSRVIRYLPHTLTVFIIDKNTLAKGTRDLLIEKIHTKMGIIRHRLCISSWSPVTLLIRMVR